MQSYNPNRKYISLSDRISWNHLSFVKNMLSSDDLLDLTYKKGSLFILAIENNHLEMTKIMLDYFHDIQLFEYASYYQNYYILKKQKQMHDILKNVTDDIEISNEMKELLKDYINFDDISTDISTDHDIFSEEKENKDTEITYLKLTDNIQKIDLL